MSDILVRPGQVQKKLGVSKSTLWRMIREGKLPPPRKLTDRCSVWWESEILKAVTEIIGTPGSEGSQ
jgi:predicted DNA-binding transcriptional regulator AlpA